MTDALTTHIPAVDTTPPSRRLRIAATIGIGLLALATVAGLLILGGGPHLLLPAGGSGTLGDFNAKIESVKGPATAAFGATSGLGLLAGGAMTGLGMQSGIRMMTLSGLAGGGVVLGNGLIA